MRRLLAERGASHTFTYQRFLTQSRRDNISEYCGDHDFDFNFRVMHEYVTVHCPLHQIESLVGPHILPGSPEFLEAARKYPCAMQMVNRGRYAHKLSCNSLDELSDGHLALTLLRSPNRLIVRSLTRDYRWEHSIVSMPDTLGQDWVCCSYILEVSHR